VKLDRTEMFMMTWMCGFTIECFRASTG